jgi:hypothetical protein
MIPVADRIFVCTDAILVAQHRPARSWSGRVARGVSRFAASFGVVSDSGFPAPRGPVPRARGVRHPPALP